MKNITIAIILCILGASQLIANETDTKRLKMEIGPQKQGILLLNTSNKEKPTGHLFGYIGRFQAIAGKQIARAKNTAGKYGYINAQGEWLIEPTLDEAKTFSTDAIARVRRDKKWGFVKPDGKWLIEPKYYLVSPFYHGFAVVQVERQSLYFYLDTEGKHAFGQGFAYAKPFCENLEAVVAKKETIPLYEVTPEGVTKKETRAAQAYWGRIDKQGHIVVPLRYQSHKEVACPKTAQKRKRAQKNQAVVKRISGVWKIINGKKKSKTFDADILAPLAEASTSVHQFTDGLIAMIDTDRAIRYYDSAGEWIYTLTGNAEQHLTLYNAQHHVLWSSSQRFVKAYASLARGVHEHFDDKTLYSEAKILSTAQALLESPSRRYQIPNLIFGREDKVRDPYQISGESNSIRRGAVAMLAHSYVGEYAWGNNGYLMGYESDQFGKYLKVIRGWITKKYGKPMVAKSYRTVWNIEGKQLILEIHSDTGDGDFYHLLTLQAQKDNK